MVTSCHFFDHASTTPSSDEIRQALLRFEKEDFGNPSSAHILGRSTQQAVHEAKVFFADAFKLPSPDQVIFTGSGTEANNLAIQGVALQRFTQQFKKNAVSKGQRICFSSTEHAAVANTARSLQDFGFEAHPLPVQTNGQLIEEEFERGIRESGVLVSIHQVNSITGALLPVERLARTAKRIRPEVYFHTDAIQGFGKTTQVFEAGGIDLVSISAHKIGGPKGIGALLILNPGLLKSGLRPLIWGGNQQSGLRSGTQSPGLISAFHLAAKLRLKRLSQSLPRIHALRQALKNSLTERKLLPELLHWNSPEESVPHIISLSALGVDPSHLSRMLEDQGLVISTRSACSSKKLEPEPVLQAMGFSMDHAQSAFRISLAEDQTLDEIEKLVVGLEQSLKRLHALRPSFRRRS